MRTRRPLRQFWPCHPAHDTGVAGLLPLIAVWADELARAPTGAVRPRTAAWYDKRAPTFSDAIAAVRRALWRLPGLSMSHLTIETVEIPTALLQRLTNTLCHAA